MSPNYGYRSRVKEERENVCSSSKSYYSICPICSQRGFSLSQHCIDCGIKISDYTQPTAEEIQKILKIIYYGNKYDPEKLA